MLFDPLRKREVADTPEERVRQWFIGVLKDPMGVPEHFMMSEVSLKLGSKPFRADIVVWSKQAEPLIGGGQFILFLILKYYFFGSFKSHVVAGEQTNKTN